MYLQIHDNHNHYLVVSLQELSNLKLLDKISSRSFIKNSKALLCTEDAITFIRTKVEITTGIKPVRTENAKLIESFIDQNIKFKFSDTSSVKNLTVFSETTSRICLSVSQSFRSLKGPKKP